MVKIIEALFDSDSDSSLFFHSTLIPNLKHSLSLTLNHFFPLAGNLLWPENSPLPFILYSPNDAVSFTASRQTPIKDCQPFVPTIQPSDGDSCAAVPLMSIQVTHFPNHGFSIGFATHHVLFDGQSFNLFLKSWAHISKLTTIGATHLELEATLPPELTPSFERAANVLQNPFVPKTTTSLSFDSSHFPPSNWIYSKTYNSHPSEVQKQEPNSYCPNDGESMGYGVVQEETEESVKMNLKSESLSTFVVAYAYVLICLIKAKQEECKEHVNFSISADVRGLLDPPVSSNYFGNCVTHPAMLVEAREFRGESGFPKMAKKISHPIVELRRTRAVEVLKISDVQQQERDSFM
ncbi:phenolic glucoside malonyltransferase 1-like [Momordica charantia]|uniref:Phenolic glucoside malonyltransferase 1-like n=1 Tax=Momordica charantia TaxID=3673 RepID=A0A6J1BVN5_MOMCH|nr:phenolic glucoside malonyltransferase 1-like [Momordica charantia]